MLPGYYPSVNGEYLYAMYYVVPHQHSGQNNTRSSPTNALLRMVGSGGNGTSASTDAESICSDDIDSVQVAAPPPPKPTSVSTSRVIPVGKGIVSRPILTGTPWNIANNLAGEPDFYPLSIENPSTDVDHGNFRDLVVVPIFDGQGRVIAVLEALNKKNPSGNSTDYDEDKNDDKGINLAGADAGGGFTDQDVEVLVSLASHVSVSLQSIYQDSEEEELRLRDTIHILKEGMGIRRSRTSSKSSSSGDSRDHDSGNDSNTGERQFRKRVRLFPD